MSGVIRQGLAWSVAGIAAGLALAMAMGGLLRAFLFDVTATDTLSLAGAALMMMVVSGLAAYAPARRVSTIDPATTLRG